MKQISLISYIKKQKNSEIILLDTPTHGNLGDAAIVLAEKEFLKRTLNIESIIEVTAQQIDGMENYYSLFTDEKKTILIHGGGFLGDLWPNEEKRFRKIITSFKKNKIVVLPQTIHYDFSKQNSITLFEDSKEIYESNKNLIIFAREKKSYEFLKKNYKNINIYSVPDIVTTLQVDLGDFERNGILFCMRSDLEKIVKNEEEQQIIHVVKNTYPDEIISYTDTVIHKTILPNDRKTEVYSKLEQFAKSKLVITDRLHGMIFAALTNTPCIALGNSSGKVEGVYEWIKENQYIYYLDKASNISKALETLNLNKKYKYQLRKIEEYFKPLVDVLEGENKHGRK